MIIADSRMINNAKSLKERIDELIGLTEWKTIAFCSAFLTVEDAKYLIRILKDIEGKINPKITFMVGIKNYFTSPDAILLLLEYLEMSKFDNYQMLLPNDKDFHIKCYVFFNDIQGNLILGSANLTDTGLKSIGELSVEIQDLSQIYDIVECLDAYAVNSFDWEDKIELYAGIFRTNSPKISKEYSSKIIDEAIKIENNSKKIKSVAPTMGMLYSLDLAANNRIKKTYFQLKDLTPNIISSFAVLYVLDLKDKNATKVDYPVGSYFDRPVFSNKEWNIGDKRMIARVGGYGETEIGELVMFMSRGCIHYRVNKAILSYAKELGIYDESQKPEAEAIAKYINFIKKNR